VAHIIRRIELGAAILSTNRVAAAGHGRLRDRYGEPAALFDRGVARTVQYAGAGPSHHLEMKGLIAWRLAGRAFEGGALRYFPCDRSNLLDDLILLSAALTGKEVSPAPIPKAV
jgi:hypothetical protein